MNQKCSTLRKDILNISYSSGHGHIPSCFSVVECLQAVFETMRHKPGDPSWPERDMFVLSKGHAALAYYCVLARAGYFPIEDVYAFGGFESTFGCHADRHKVPGVEASTGSLGHGIGLAVGMALAMKIKKRSNRVLTLIGDGEANEGTVWEALLVADSLKLDNLTVIYDNNQSHGRGLQIQKPAEKFRAFGCHVVESNGHDMDDLKQAIGARPDGVLAIVANTVKGYGCRQLSENQYEWHRKSPDQSQLTAMLEELDAQTV